MTDGKPYVTVLCDGFPFVGVWTIEKTHPFVCLEPWYGVCDSKNFTGELKERQGIQSLKAWGDLGKRLQHQDRVICLVYNRKKIMSTGHKTF